MMNPHVINANDDSKDYSRWKIIYPNYLNRKKKVKEGRKINLDYCVADPSVDEIALACKELQVQYVVEKNKYYPRDWLVEGRIRIKMPDSGSSNIYSKFALMKQIGLKLQTIKANVGPTTTVNANSATKKKKKKKNKD
ncbi:signal recognition particle subunit SRP19, putative [Plasmodium knowlesi strain H]|uniref:Signal recognition particle subunit SRP19, putative n=3 Tax=Plasmodium knowlesi TaxID=5850 RepID=A0A5K1V7U5_PLAKH|nr:signal recognition particle subunit SRP19, putative [Plasmodium knowlesi strain H]OTN63746.1 putative Signal recognition particle 19 kd protein [Plasmodium knowlesi]CAA9990956.1 signal recognition particle subunit SRP19, putative [Plasmodium knowlesi strain H]SBO20819.1 signal recognition particle subunit SRP19, putative [Plasmodium knowlesi strain H]SBO21243.1 signal recognition particle subunit SRP19, putative [Plasmodium knowlesi strain H]VVS80430.1 signal recognition particle subunit SR|eukprot:XP_002262239.1 signal recognition particle 19 kd protein,putative [Plasmodium knowlesi strain H]